jgi:hypothetical protein
MPPWMMTGCLRTICPSISWLEDRHRQSLVISGDTALKKRNPVLVIRLGFTS